MGFLKWGARDALPLKLNQLANCGDGRIKPRRANLDPSSGVDITHIAEALASIRARVPDTFPTARFKVAPVAASDRGGAAGDNENTDVVVSLAASDSAGETIDCAIRGHNRFSFRGCGNVSSQCELSCDETLNETVDLNVVMVRDSRANVRTRFQELNVRLQFI